MTKNTKTLWLKAFQIHPHTWVCEWEHGTYKVRCVCTTKRDVKALSRAIGAFKVDWLKAKVMQ